MTARLAALAALLLAVASVTSAQTAPDRVASAPASFLDGLAALHSFEYEEANAAFLQAQRDAPSFALAFWGEALTYSQTLWGKEDVAAGRRALAKLAPSASARARRAASDRERGLVEAAEILFGDGDQTTRHRRYADRLGQLHAADRNDADVAALYALALLGTTSRSLIGSHEGHGVGLAGSDVQRQVGEILGRVLTTHPKHPGALHYLIHAYDDPEHAHLALDAARTYAGVAPQSSHALHMPAHVFLQLGRWAEAEASDRAAFAASEAWVVAKGLPEAMKNYHALAWRQYELLQLGRMTEARGLVDQLAPVVKATGDLTLLSDLSSMRARQVLESRHYVALANERNFGNAVELAAIGISAARAGNPPLAELARGQLAARAAALEEGDLRPAIAIMERQVAGLQALAAGDATRAVSILAAATEAELMLPPPLGLPIPVVPAPELLGEVLLELKRPAEAAEQFERALRRNANRSRSVLGLARSMAALGRRDEAHTHYRAVLESYANADVDRPEIAEARAAVAGSVEAASGPRMRFPGGWAAAAGAAIAAAAALWAVRRRPSRAPAPLAPPPSRERPRRERKKK